MPPPPSGEVVVTAAGLVVFGVGTGVWDAAMNLEGAIVEQKLGKTVMPRYHAGFSLGTVVAAGGALAWWAVATDPAAPPYLAQLQRYPPWLVVVGVIGFALVNPVWEEALFRGVVLGDLTAVWGSGPAVVVQAVLFGTAHWAGFPSGWVGMAMAAGWGLVLGVLRFRTHGIAVPYLVHVSANTVIGSLAVVLL